MAFRFGVAGRDQADAPEPVAVLAQTVQQVGVLRHLGAADLHQDRLTDPIGVHGLQQFPDWLLAAGGAVFVHRARKLRRWPREHVGVGIDARHCRSYCSKLNSRRRSGVVHRCAMEVKVSGSTRPSVRCS